MSGLHGLPPDLPAPVDDGACAHLVGMAMPHIILPSTAGREVDVGALGSGRTLIFCYPRTGVPGEDLPEGWDAIPGARGCTPQACAFRDHQRELAGLDAVVLGLSTQDTAYQREMVDRLHLPFEILSDALFQLTNALRLPTFEVSGMRPDQTAYAHRARGYNRACILSGVPARRARRRSRALVGSES